MKTSNFKFIPVLIIMFVSLGCNTGKPKNFDYGHIENHIYHNSFFNMQVSLPANWVVQNKEQLENIKNAGKKIVTGDDKDLKAIINASEINTANLLAVFKYEIGAPVEKYNSSFMLVAENLKTAPGIKNGHDYLFQSRKLLKKTQLKFDFIDEDFKKIMIDNQEFYTMNVVINYMNNPIHQLYYSTVKNGFGLIAVESYQEDDQKNELDNVIKSIKFFD